MSEPSVSVIIPSYNHAAFLGEAIESALSQSLPPIEVLVVDDGSTDGSFEVAREFGDRIRFFAREHQGIAANYNFGVGLARGPWIAFLESDDALEPRYLAAVFRFIDANPDVAWVSTGRLWVDAQGRGTGYIQRKHSPGSRYTTESLLRQDLGLASTPVARRDALLATGPFDPRTYGADTDMALRFSLRFPMGYLDEPVYRYRRHGANTSWSERRNTLEVIEIVRRFRDEHPDYARAHAALIRRCFGRYHGMLGTRIMDTDAAARRRDILPHLWNAVRNDPARIKHWRRLATVSLLGPRIAGGWRRIRRRLRDRRHGVLSSAS